MRLIAGLLAAIFLSAASGYSAGELSNRRAPGFSLPDVNLRQHDLGDHRGKIVLLDIMQTNCPHCRTFTSVLEEAKKKYGDKIVVLSVVNPPDTQATVRRFLQETRSTIPVLFDCGQMSASYLKVTPENPRISVPHLFIIDPEGWIRNDYGYGPDTKDVFEGRELFNVMDKMLAGTKR